MPTVQGVKYLIHAPDIPDEQIQWYIDNGYESDIDIAIAICDFMLSKSNVTGNTERITVGPITLQSSNSSSDWDRLKRDLILRKNTGAGLPGGSLFTGDLGVGGTVLTGGGMPPAVQRGQFNNPPNTLSTEGEFIPYESEAVRPKRSN